MAITTEEMKKRGDLPPYLSTAFEEMVQTAKELSKKRYEPYTERRVSRFSPLMNQYFDIVSRSGDYEPHFAEALKNIRKGRRSFVGSHKKYMKPYKESVLNKLPSRATRTFEAGIMPELQKRFLNTRHPTSLRNKHLAQKARSDLKNVYEEQVSEGMSKAYKDALVNYNIHKARQLEAAHPLTTIGISRQTQRLSHAQALRDSGNLIYDLEQRLADLAYENWKERQRHPYEALSQYASSVQGIPFVPSIYQRTEIPRPSNTWHGSDWKNLGLNILGDTLMSGINARKPAESGHHSTGLSSFAPPISAPLSDPLITGSALGPRRERTPQELQELEEVFGRAQRQFDRTRTIFY